MSQPCVYQDINSLTCCIILTYFEVYGDLKLITCTQNRSVHLFFYEPKILLQVLEKKKRHKICGKDE